ncbi:hypothetical protein LOC51_19930 [Rubrivivax sp. JA1024]|nr:hypothetical protein [Rubrivivax sp. JA1024]
MAREFAGVLALVVLASAAGLYAETDQSLSSIIGEAIVAYLALLGALTLAEPWLSARRRPPADDP